MPNSNYLNMNRDFLSSVHHAHAQSVASGVRSRERVCVCVTVSLLPHVECRAIGKNRMTIHSAQSRSSLQNTLAGPQEAHTYFFSARIASQSRKRVRTHATTLADHRKTDNPPLAIPTTPPKTVTTNAVLVAPKTLHTHTPEQKPLDICVRMCARECASVDRRAYAKDTNTSISTQK